VTIMVSTIKRSMTLGIAAVCVAAGLLSPTTVAHAATNTYARSDGPLPSVKFIPFSGAGVRTSVFRLSDGQTITLTVTVAPVRSAPASGRLVGLPARATPRPTLGGL